MHFYGWKRGLKTGSYYLRTRPAAQAIQFTIDAKTLKGRSKDAHHGLALTYRTEAKANAASAKPIAITPAASSSSIETVVTPLRQISIATKADEISVPDSVAAASTSRASRHEPESSPGPSEEEEISYEEAKKRAEERAEAALQCSIDNKEACLMCSG